MNYLAHQYLSNDSEALMIGNFIADAVKGKEIDLFSSEIQKGIKLHRAIDEYTDSHEIVLQSKVRLRDKYSKYAPVIVDMFYDHFLASNWDQYADTELKTYSKHVYKIMFNNFNQLPSKMQMMLPFMAKSNWLYSYREVSGIHKALSGLARRTKFDSGMETASHDLKQDYEAYKEEFEQYFPQLVSFVDNYIKAL